MSRLSSKDTEFWEKRVLVVGAAGALGRSVTGRLVTGGAHVTAMGQEPEALHSLQREIPRVQVVLVEDPLDWESAAQAVVSRGPLDLMVNCALATGLRDTDKDLKDGQGLVDRILGTNLKAFINLSQAVSVGMRVRGGGSIVNVFSQWEQSSDNKGTFPGLLSYCCFKSALDLATKVLAADLSSHKIRVNAVNPILLEESVSLKVMSVDPDNMEELLCHTPMGKTAEVDRVSDAILFLLSERSSGVSGVTLNVDGLLR